MGTSGGVTVSKLDLQTYTCEFESHWVPHSFGLVLHRSKELCKLLFHVTLCPFFSILPCHTVFSFLIFFFHISLLFFYFLIRFFFLFFWSCTFSFFLSFFFLSFFLSFFRIVFSFPLSLTFQSRFFYPLTFFSPPTPLFSFRFDFYFYFQNFLCSTFLAFKSCFVFSFLEIEGLQHKQLSVFHSTITRPINNLTRPTNVLFEFHIYIYIYMCVCVCVCVCVLVLFWGFPVWKGIVIY